MAVILDLRRLFTAVAYLEAAYFLIAMVPPSWVQPLTGWVLNADGHWIVKLIGMALGTQALIAWLFRKEPHLGVARVLAAYQMASATVDWVMWLVLKEDGVFSNTQAQVGVIAAIVSHYSIGILMFIAVGRAQKGRE
jgi:hypothetical protein